MDKTGARSLAQVPACDGFEPLSSTATNNDESKTCGKCLFYSHAKSTRLKGCPFETSPRPEDPRD